MPVISIGDSIPYANQSLWLRLDLDSLRTTTPETIGETTWCVRKKYGEPGILLPPFERFRSGISRERWAVVEENRGWIEASPTLFADIIAEHQAFRYPKVPDLDVDAALYEIDFMSEGDQRLCRLFHEGDTMARIHLLSRFLSEETREMAVRVLSRNYPDQLPKRYHRRFKAYMAAVNPDSKENGLLDYRGRVRTTPVGAMQSILKLRGDISLSDQQQRLLDGLAGHIRRAFNRNLR